MNTPTAGELKAARRIADGYRMVIDAITGSYDEANDHEKVIQTLAQVIADERTTS